ncbi:MAG TPA: isochorismatase family cysteine hydrolase [Bryobacteraceae bacterium]|nr:isochorismatase family cysteine hydrolase [Bryobacteraceae bacterium]
MRTVFFDVDTQIDFLYPAGALYVPGAERIAPAVSRLNHFAAARGIPLISSMDAHAENDPEFSVWPPHCIAGTLGQRKPEATLVEGRVTIPNVECALPLEAGRQFILEKQTVNAFECRNIHKLLDALQAERYVVYGVVTEVCVLHAVRGLLQTGKPVTVVTDAIETLDAANSTQALAEMQASGASLALVSAIAG